MLISSTELRGWITLISAVIGALIALATYENSVKQYMLDNTYKTLDYLRKHITQQQINTFIKLFKAYYTPEGISNKAFVIKGEKQLVKDMFSDGGCGTPEIHNIIEVFNTVGKVASDKSLNDNLIWYEYGQIMETCHRWIEIVDEEMIKELEKQGAPKESYTPMSVSYSQFSAYVKKYNESEYPMKYYVSAE